MSLEALDENAIRPTQWPRYVRGYTEFTEHVAIASDVWSALGQPKNFDQAALKAWFATGYLLALIGDHGGLSCEARRPESAELPELLGLLIWLAQIHGKARDNSPVTDSAQLGHTFSSHAKASLTGLQFQKHVPVINNKGEMLQPNRSEIQQSLLEADVISISQQMNERILPKSIWLGDRHRQRFP